MGVAPLATQGSNPRLADPGRDPRQVLRLTRLSLALDRLRPCRAATAATAAGSVRQLANDSRTRFFAAVELTPQTAGTPTCSTSPWPYPYPYP